MMNNNAFKCEFCGSLNSMTSLRNTNNKKKGIYGSIYYNLTISEVTPFPKTLYGIKAEVKEKGKAFLMLDKIQTDFNISDWDIQKWRLELLKKEHNDFKDMQKQADLMKKKGFTRDTKGNIISPFASKEKLK